jgi:hypothetical protein
MTWLSRIICTLLIRGACMLRVPIRGQAVQRLRPLLTLCITVYLQRTSEEVHAHKSVI